MSNATYRQWMKDAGWTAFKIGSETGFEVDLGDRKLNALPKFSKTTSQFIVYDFAGIWREDWALAKSCIFPKFAPSDVVLIRRKNTDFATDGDGTPEFIKEMTDTLLSWAKAVDPSQEIENHAAPKDRYALGSWDHITALAMLGKTDQLTALKDGVKSANKVLHSKITTDDMDRALKLSAEMSASGDTLAFLREIAKSPA